MAAMGNKKVFVEYLLIIKMFFNRDLDRRRAGILGVVNRIDRAFFQNKLRVVRTDAAVLRRDITATAAANTLNRIVAEGNENGAFQIDSIVE